MATCPAGATISTITHTIINTTTRAAVVAATAAISKIQKSAILAKISPVICPDVVV